MSLSNFGITRFDGTGDSSILDWLDQFSLALIASDIKAERHKALLLTHLAPGVFTAVKTYLLPKDVMDATAVDLNAVKDALKTLYHKPPNRGMARVQFSQLTQHPGEAISTFAQRLRDAAAHCEFGGGYDERMRDQLTTGVRVPDIRRALLTAKAAGTFEALVAVAEQEELLLRDIQTFNINLTTPAAQVNAVAHTTSAQQLAPGTPCTGCGGRHLRQDCPHRQTPCYNCGKPGHLARMCRQPRQAAPRNVHSLQAEAPPQADYASAPQAADTRSHTDEGRGYIYGIRATYDDASRSPPMRSHPWSHASFGQGPHFNGSDATAPQDTSPGDSSCGRIFSLQHSQPSAHSTPDLMLQASVEGCPVSFRLDTGADETVMPLHVYHRLGFPRSLLQPTRERLHCYSGQSIAIHGIASVRVNLGQQQLRQLPLFIVRSGGPTLFGRSWLAAFGLGAVWQALSSASPSPPDISAASQAPTLHGGRSLRPLHNSTRHPREGAWPSQTVARANGNRLQCANYQRRQAAARGRPAYNYPAVAGETTAAPSQGLGSPKAPSVLCENPTLTGNGHMQRRGPLPEFTGMHASGSGTAQRGTHTRTGQGRPPRTSGTPGAADAAADAVIQRSQYCFMSPLDSHHTVTGSELGTLPAPRAHVRAGRTYAVVARQPPPSGRRSGPLTHFGDSPGERAPREVVEHPVAACDPSRGPVRYTSQVVPRQRSRARPLPTSLGDSSAQRGLDRAGPCRADDSPPSRRRCPALQRHSASGAGPRGLRQQSRAPLATSPASTLSAGGGVLCPTQLETNLINFVA